ncbi:16S rRNA (guanine(966)-N(2))-methyltransferase RsmD [Coraliomargarita akajimensis]|uniref:Methyltransferase n=1 Tax=Coraliomargarita akajimensis (strain DSM 45221 / IAM 15411 / JCM 23193 / KCTC 12865 / 04OKA010-24) TaxID=583355 RepID=D5EK90_CORAD|nr:16S rRNA (guanine(966)-N(2))-methyltransferase RsmD [Coraliomargarita akajimensis]ADE54839.1 methyltransferase [Coraliomargarita akajimensis DSM 45221]
MRITGGRARGIPLKAPKGGTTRPATDRMRESVFSSLGPSLENCSVADLFAGTGSYGLEALSRGASSVTFFENDRSALACLKQNLAAVTRSAQIDATTSQIESRDVYSLSEYPRSFNLIFLDPPYATIAGNLQQIFDSCVNPIANDESRVIMELPGNLHPEIINWELIRRIGKAGRDKPTVAIFEPA